MLEYVPPTSPESWLGKEDFWVIGEEEPDPVERRLTGGLFNRLLYPMLGGGSTAMPVQPSEIGLKIRSRTGFGMPERLNPADNTHPWETARLAHKERFGTSVVPNAVLIQAAGVLAVIKDVELIDDICQGRNSGGIPDIAPIFAERLGRLILPRLSSP